MMKMKWEDRKNKLILEMKGEQITVGLMTNINQYTLIHIQEYSKTNKSVL